MTDQITNNSGQFKKYLEKFSKNITDSKLITHTSFQGGKYAISDEYYDEFNKNYYRALQNNEELYLIERINDTTKFSFFLDIEVPKGSAEYFITKEDINVILSRTVELQKTFFKNYNEKLGEYVISMRNNKFHINFPNMIVNSSMAITFGKELLSMLETSENKHLKNYIDMSVYRTGLRMLGSKKSDATCEKEREEHGENYQMCYQVVDNNLETIKLNFNIFLQTIVRKKADKKILEINPEFTLKVTQQQKSKTSIKGIENTKVVSELTKLINDIDLIGYFKNCGHETKPEIGRIVAKQNKQGLFYFYVTLLDKYCPFKMREHSRDSSPMYLEICMNGIYIKCYDDECKFKKFPDGGIPLPENFDSRYPELFLSMNTKYWNTDVKVDQELRTLLEESLSGSHYKIAKVAFHIYKNRFRVDEVKNPEWYEFDGILWKKSYVMNILISEDLPRYYKAIKISDVSSTSDKQGLQEFLETNDRLESNLRNELVDSIVSKLENVSFKKSVLTEMTYLFKALEPNFLSKLDDNPYLLAFKNGVYDLRTHTLREGDKNDYITYSTKYDYIEYNSESQEVKEIYAFLQKIIPNPSVLDYLLKVLGRSLLGINDERFYIFTGLSGANGKSTLVNFLEYTLGDYAIGVDVSLLTNKRGLSSNASPDVMRIKGRRLVTFQEPEANDVLKTGIIKAFSGGDTIVARDLFKSPISFKIQATMLMCCNDIPAINSVDGGTFRRLRVIDYTSRFCDNPTKPNEFMIDPSIKWKITQWKPYFMSMLLHYYTKYDEEVKIYGKIKEPVEVMAATNKYKAENDLFDEYLMECIEADENSFESNTSIYNHFNSWWIQNYSHNKIPSPKELKKSMKIKFGDETEQMKKLGFKIRIKDVQTEHIKDDY